MIRRDKREDRPGPSILRGQYRLEQRSPIAHFRDHAGRDQGEKRLQRNSQPAGPADLGSATATRSGCSADGLATPANRIRPGLSLTYIDVRARWR